MVPFSYLRRVTSTVILRRLLSLDENALPQTIKFVASKALNSDEIAFQSYHRHTGEGLSHMMIMTVIEQSTGQDLSALLQEKIRHTTADEWMHSAIITVVYYLSQAGARLTDATKSMLFKKIASTDQLNLIDLWQLLSAAKKLHIKLPLTTLKHHLECNIDKLLVNGSCKNVNSVLYAFAACGTAIEPRVLLYIAEYYRKEMAHRAPFKDRANFVNCFALHVNMDHKGIGSKTDTHTDGHASVTGGLLDTLEALIEECLEDLEVNNGDLEGMIDILDAIMLSTRCRRPDGQDYRQQYVRIGHLLNAINSGLKRNAEASRANVYRLKCDELSTSRNVEPRILRVVLRNLVLAGMEQSELLAQIMGMYRCQPNRWSAKGNADVLRSVVFFGYRGPEVGDLAGHISSMYHGDFSKHVDAGNTLIDVCMLAVSSSSQPYYRSCLRLVSSAMTAIDTITTDDIALAMMILGLVTPSYEVVPLDVMRRIVKRLQGNVTLQVHTRESAASALRQSVVYDTVYHNHFAGFCKVKLK